MALSEEVCGRIAFQERRVLNLRSEERQFNPEGLTPACDSMLETLELVLFDLSSLIGHMSEKEQRAFLDRLSILYGKPFVRK